MARRVENQFLLHQSNRTCITGTYILDISKKIKCKGNVTKGKSILSPPPHPPPPITFKKEQTNKQKKQKKAKEILGLDF